MDNNVFTGYTSGPDDAEETAPGAFEEFLRLAREHADKEVGRMFHVGPSLRPPLHIDPPDLEHGPPDRLFGFPVYITPWLPQDQVYMVSGRGIIWGIGSAVEAAVPEPTPEYAWPIWLPFVVMVLALLLLVLLV